MRSDPVHVVATCLILGTASEPTHAQVFSSEFHADPVSEGWDLIQTICAQTWVEDATYHQQFNPQTCSTTGSGAGQDAYVRSIADFNGQPQFFLEFRIRTNGDRSEIPRGAPAGMSMFNRAGMLYHVTVARDLAKFIPHFDLSGRRFIEIEPDISHTFRIELYPDWYVLYIDRKIADEGVPDGPFPAHDARLTWLGASWELPAENAWDYVRYGVTPLDASGDYDSDGVVTLNDFYFFHECLSNRRPGINGGPGQDAGPGCRFADFNADSSTDMLDLATLQLIFDQPP